MIITGLKIATVATLPKKEELSSIYLYFAGLLFFIQFYKILNHCKINLKIYPHRHLIR